MSAKDIAENVCKEILREEYADFDENSWHYDRELKMLKEAYEKGTVAQVLFSDGEKQPDTTSKCNKQNVMVSLLSDDEINKRVDSEVPDSDEYKTMTKREKEIALAATKAGAKWFKAEICNEP